MTPPRHRPRGNPEGPVWRRTVQYVVGRDFGVCHICGHTGATSGDHVISVTERPDLAHDLSNIKAAHAWPHPCPTCSPAAIARGGKPVYCNEVKQGWSLERARRKIEERTGLALIQDQDQPQGERAWDLFHVRPGFSVTYW